MVGRDFIKILTVLFLCAAPLGCSYSYVEKSSTFPPGTISGDFPDFDHYADADPTVTKLATEVATEVLQFLETVFVVQDVQDMKCGAGTIFQKFIDRYFRNPKGLSPKVRFVCLAKLAENDDQLEWILNDHSDATWTILPPNDLFSLDLSDIRSIVLSSDSTLRMNVDGDTLNLDWNGITINLNSKVLVGTSYSWIPESFLSFQLESIQAKNDGRFTVNLRLPFGIPYSYKGALQVYSYKNHSLHFHKPDGKPLF